MQTQKVKTNSIDCRDSFNARNLLRFMDEDLWIDKYASGTLRKNKRVGAIWKAQYIEERIHFEFGVGFEHLSAARVNFNDVRTEFECKP
jgi:hypothetical protein